jgi:hypothetical protein
VFPHCLHDGCIWWGFAVIGISPAANRRLIVGSVVRRLDAGAVAIFIDDTSIHCSMSGVVRKFGTPRSTPKAIAAGFGSGATTMVAHTGDPPLAMYLLPLGLSKGSMPEPPACFSPSATP